MPVLGTALDVRSPGFRANAEAMFGLVSGLRVEADRVREGGGETVRQRYLGRGKLLPRD